MYIRNYTKALAAEICAIQENSGVFKKNPRILKKNKALLQTMADYLKSCNLLSCPAQRCGQVGGS
jgi:hypothetical protein